MDNNDIIKLLPDAVANQIAAGEVIQRPASVVKELLENALDAGATQIDLFVKEAGKTAIMVIDNGIGMSETDARLSFERHATSKIHRADDLFAIRTMGFRGEALASIAAIAQVELKTRRKTDELGTKILIEGSVVKSQEMQPMPEGTTFTIKNLFFNVPARRNFLKSNQAEMRHIIDEFHRVVLMHPEIGFSFSSNEKELFHLYPGTLKQRIVALFGNNYNERLLPVEQATSSVSVNGFVGKPAFARKTRGEQYFFVNRRFIKHAYLHHAVENAFQELLPKDSFPSYFINIEINPTEIDINIHPTKTEINFQDSKLVYAIIHAAVKKTIGQHNLSPLIDFDVDPKLNIDFSEISRANRQVVHPTVSFDPEFNPFEKTKTQSFNHHEKQKNIEGWRNLYGERIDTHSSVEFENTETQQTPFSFEEVTKRFIQVQRSYIITSIKSGLMVINQHLAHWRILYEDFLKRLENTKQASQQELFPQQIRLNATEASLLRELIPDLKTLGFGIEEINQTTFVINGTPVNSNEKDVTQTLEKALENYKRNQHDLHLEKRLNLARSMALQLAIRNDHDLQEVEMTRLVDKLFACNVPDVAPNGQKIFFILKTNEIESRFNETK